MTEPAAVLVVDDHTLVRTGVVNIISHETDLRVVAEASNGAEAVVAFAKHRPDVVLLDLRMPVMEGVEAVRQIREIDPAARVIVLTTYDTDEDITRAIAAVWTDRTDRYSDLRSEETAGLHKIEMSFIGG